MERDLIEDLDVFERTSDFWTLSRNEILLKHITIQPIMDVGCGSGILTKQLVENKFNVYSLDIEKRAKELTSRFNDERKIFVKSFETVTLKDVPKLGTIIFADVLEHVDMDVEFLLKANELLQEGGKVVISVPCHDFLWTKNDEVRGHKRRYTKQQLSSILEYAGFKVDKMFYWNFLSVPVILLAKIAGSRVPHEGVSESKLNGLLSFYFTKIENKLPVPFGSTLICIARKER
ncbi:MAG: methyltransferase domain-containing protein [DPANN group archaeon]|nr:methyltransferase domain-containing protein [DPANN group archaeon]